MNVMDFVKKFAALHKSYSPNQERDLYSASSLFGFLNVGLLLHTVHLTSVTDKLKTALIIQNGVSDSPLWF